MTESPDIETRQDRLYLAELDLCQKHIDNSTMRSWQSAGILLAGTIAALTLMLHISGSDDAAAVITTAFALGAILILELWLDLVRREDVLRQQSLMRMRLLEDRLGFRRQDGIKKADAVWRSRFSFLPSGHTATLEATGLTVQLGWVAVVVWRWLIVAGAL